MTLTQETYGELEEIAARYPEARSGLLPMLHLVQSVEGRVTPEGIEACAEILGISAAEVGGDAIFERLKDHLDVGNDETTEDGKITLEHVECNAACDYAPVMMVNWEFMDNMTPQSAVQLVDDLRGGKEVSSTRGPRLCTWREAERVLAGFPDGRVDEGPAAGPASLVGLQLARANNWTAHSSDSGTRELGAAEGHPVEEADSNPTRAAAVDESSTASETGAEKDEAK